MPRARINFSELHKIAGAVRQRIVQKFPAYRSSKASSVSHSMEMAKAARIKKTDIVLDPFGGAGFSSAIIAHFNPKQMIIQDFLYTDKTHPTPKVLEREWESLDGKYPKTRFGVIAADSGASPLRDSCIDKIVTSPPYFLKLRSRPKAEAVFEKTIPEMRRVLKNNGLLVLKVPAFWELRHLPFHGFDLESERILDSQNKLMVFKLKK